MNAPKPAPQVRFEVMTKSDLDTVTALEQQVHAHPWQNRHFSDCLASGYEAQLLMADDHLLGYFVAMKGVDEVHLLNLVVAPGYQGQGWARVMLDALTLWSIGQGAQWLWLEARHTNTRAIHIYQTHGFRHMGVRREYYPAAEGRREDAVIMSLQLKTAVAQEPAP